MQIIIATLLSLAISFSVQAKTVTVENNWLRCLHYVTSKDFCASLKPVKIVIHCTPDCTPKDVDLNKHKDKVTFTFKDQAWLHVEYKSLIDLESGKKAMHCLVKEDGKVIRTTDIENSAPNDCVFAQ